MHWTDWLLIVVGGAVMIGMLYCACYMLNWMVAMMTALRAIQGGF